MHNVVFIKHLESINELFEDIKCLLFWQSFFFSEQTFQSTSVTVLIDKVEVVWSFKHVYILDDVLMFFDVGKDVNFVNSTLLKFLIFFESTHLDNFNRILLTIKFVDSSIDFAIGSFTNDLIQCVVLDNSNHDMNIL